MRRCRSRSLYCRSTVFIGKELAELQPQQRVYNHEDTAPLQCAPGCIRFVLLLLLLLYSYVFALYCCYYTLVRLVRLGWYCTFAVCTSTLHGWNFKPQWDTRIRDGRWTGRAVYCTLGSPALQSAWPAGWQKKNEPGRSGAPEVSPFLLFFFDKKKYLLWWSNLSKGVGKLDLKKFFHFDTIAILFLFDKYCSIIE